MYVAETQLLALLPLGMPMSRKLQLGINLQLKSSTLLQDVETQTKDLTY